MTTLNEIERLIRVEPLDATPDAGEPDVDAEALPALDFMRGYLAAHPRPELLNPTMRGWLVALIDECEELRVTLANQPIVHQRGAVNTTPFGLTPTERRVYAYLRNTLMTQREISQTMYVSINTVKTHCKNIFAKCNVERRGALRDLPNL